MSDHNHFEVSLSLKTFRPSTGSTLDDWPLVLLTKQCIAPRAFIPWTSLGVMHSGYIDLILVMSDGVVFCTFYMGEVSQKICPITTNLLPVLSGESPNSHYDLLCCCVFEPGLHREPPVLICLMRFLGKGEGRVRPTGPENVQRVTRTPARVREGPCSEF